MNTTYFLDMAAGNVFGTKKDPALPEKYYLGLSSSEPGLDGTGATEPVDGGYARVELTVMGQPENGVVTNTASIDFPESTAEWGKMTHFLVNGQETGGELLMYGALTPTRTVETATVMTIKKGALKLSVVNPAA